VGKNHGNDKVQAAKIATFDRWFRKQCVASGAIIFIYLSLNYFPWKK